MDNLANLDYVEEYGDDGTGRNIELHPTILPTECNLSAANIAEQNTVDNVHLLFLNGIINWPNFTNCLPNCGLCTQFASDQFYITYNLVVIGLLLPFISLCGLCGNVLSAIVYSRPSLRQSYSGSLYLSALGCSDALVVITALFLFFVDSIRRYSLSLSIVYGSLSPVVYPAAMIAQTCSVYFTLVAGIDCFVQVWLSTASKGLFARQCFQKTTICSVLLFGLLYNIPHCFESILLNCWHQTFQSPSVELCPAPLRFNPTYTLVYYKYMYALFLAVGPLVILIALNTAVIIGTMVCKRGNSEDNMALILVVLLFILCNSIALLINIFETHLSTALSWRINYIIDISNLLVVFNSSFNFVIYYIFSRPFRVTFLRHFCHKKIPFETAVLAPQTKREHHRHRREGINGTHKVMVTAQTQQSPLIGRNFTFEKCTSVTLWGSKNGNTQKWNETLLKEIEQNSIARMEEIVHGTRRKKMKQKGEEEEEELQTKKRITMKRSRSMEMKETGEKEEDSRRRRRKSGGEESDEEAHWMREERRNKHREEEENRRRRKSGGEESDQEAYWMRGEEMRNKRTDNEGKEDDRMRRRKSGGEESDEEAHWMREERINKHREEEENRRRKSGVEESVEIAHRMRGENTRHKRMDNEVKEDDRRRRKSGGEESVEEAYWMRGERMNKHREEEEDRRRRRRRKSGVEARDDDEQLVWTKLTSRSKRPSSVAADQQQQNEQQNEEALEEGRTVGQSVDGEPKNDQQRKNN